MKRNLFDRHTPAAHRADRPGVFQPRALARYSASLRPAAAAAALEQNGVRVQLLRPFFARCARCAAFGTGRGVTVRGGPTAGVLAARGLRVAPLGSCSARQADDQVSEFPARRVFRPSSRSRVPRQVRQGRERRREEERPQSNSGAQEQGRVRCRSTPRQIRYPAAEPEHPQVLDSCPGSPRLFTALDYLWTRNSVLALAHPRRQPMRFRVIPA